MHELSIAQSIISLAENALKENSNATVSAVRIQVGELSGIEIESLQFSFSIIKADTILHNANLEVQIVEGEAVCNTCNHIFHLKSYGESCPNCKGYSLHVLKGKEMKVLNLVVED